MKEVPGSEDDIDLYGALLQSVSGHAARNPGTSKTLNLHQQLDGFFINGTCY